MQFLFSTDVLLYNKVSSRNSYLSAKISAGHSEFSICEELSSETPSFLKKAFSAIGLIFLWK